MCKHGDTVAEWFPAVGLVDVDRCIAPIVRALNEHGLRTVASCCGHGHRPGNIALADGRELVIARNHAEARKIDDLFPVNVSGDIRSSKGGRE